jgi:hypothetical protein
MNAWCLGKAALEPRKARKGREKGEEVLGAWFFARGLWLASHDSWLVSPCSLLPLAKGMFAAGRRVVQGLERRFAGKKNRKAA